MRRITLFFLLVTIVCGTFISCQKNEDQIIVIDKITAGIERDNTFEKFTITCRNPDKEYPFEYYVADGGIVNTWATVVIEFRTMSEPEVIVEDFSQDDTCNSILLKCDRIGDGKWKAVIWATVGYMAKVTIVNKYSAHCFGISIVGDIDWIGSEEEKKYDTLTEDDFQQAASNLGVTVAVVKALDEVLSNHNGGFWTWHRPVIQFEGHIFWKELQKNGIDPYSYVSGNEDILYEKWTKAHYKPRMGEYERFTRAASINETATACATCWGAYKLMGYNYEKCGLKDARTFVQQIIESRKNQLDIFCAYVKNSGGDIYLQKLDWTGFAEYYDSAKYTVDRLGERLEQAYAKYAAESNPQ